RFGGGGRGGRALLLVVAREPKARPAGDGTAPGRAGKSRRFGGGEGFRELGGSYHPDGSSRSESRAHFHAGGAATGGRNRTGARGTIFGRDGHARDARAAAGIAGDGHRVDAGVSERW